MFVAVMLQAAVSPAQVQTAITPTPGAGSLGTQVKQVGNSYDITGGTRPGDGPNLFHSFGRFSVGEGDSASFRNTTQAVTTSNIVSRVTGGEPSNIFGTIDTLSYPGANLFLINPAGVVFGPNAKLDVGGAFHASTADYLRFADGAKLFANLSQNSVLTVARPEAFGFAAPHPAAISILGSVLQVQSGQTLSVVGGDVQLTGAMLLAPSGLVQIASVGSPGKVILSSPGEPADLNVSSFARLGRIDISGGAFIDTSGDQGGTVLIRGGRLIVDSSYLLAFTGGHADGARLGIDFRAREAIVLANGAFVGTQTSGSGRAGDISVSARTVTLAGGAAIRSQGGPGPGGDTTVTATASIDISGRDSAGTASQIATEIRGSEGIGNGGRITISAPSVALADGGSIISNAFEGRGGDIVIDKVGRLSVTGGAHIETNASRPGAQGGRVTVMADSVALSGEGSRLLSINFGSTPGKPPTLAGDISLNVRTLTLTGGAQIQSGEPDLDQGGNVDIRARDSVVISGAAGIASHAFGEKAGAVTVSAPIVAMSNGFIDTSAFSLGDAGDISVNAGRLTLTDGAQIIGLSKSTGRGGDIRVTATDSVSISGRSLTPIDEFNKNTSSGLFSTAQDAGPGGNISITTGIIQLLDGATVSSSSTGTADALAGNVKITFSDTLRMSNASITTQATKADGGVISITTTGSQMQLTDSRITTSVESGLGKGGNITIGSPFHSLDFVVLNNSQIRADAFGGPGGNIGIFADVYLTSGSLVSASSALSAPGTIDVEARITDLSGSLLQLPENVLQAASLLRAACAARIEGKASSLVIAGREGVPPEPGGLLPSPVLAGEPTGTRLSGRHDAGEPLPAISLAELDSKCSR